MGNIDFDELKKKAADLNVDLDVLLKKAMDELLVQNDNKSAGNKPKVNADKIETLSDYIDSIPDEILDNVWKKIQIARHSDRPTTLNYIEEMSDQYIEFHGDRYAGDDKAMIGGVCTLDGIHFTFIGNQKGSNMKENLVRNYGMSHSEGYRKALRLAKQAEHFARPIVTFIDTSGAYPGLASEERGIGEAIAKNLLEFSMLEVPVICIIIGEGGSGGALGIGIGDKIFMMENSVYSVISPEGFASILLRDAKRSKEAAVLMKMTAEQVLEAGFIDGIIPETDGGAHLNFSDASENIKHTILKTYQDLQNKDIPQLLQQRSQKIIGWTRGQTLAENGVAEPKPLLKRVREFFVD